MKHIIISVTNDLYGDRRVLKVAQSCQKYGFDVLLIGRKLKKSAPLDLPFKHKRLKLIFNRSALFYAEYNIRLFFLLMFSKADILLSNDTDTLLANYLVNKIRHKKLVFDAHELFPEVPELMHRPKVKQVWQKIEDWIFPHLKHCYTVCQPIADYYNEKYHIQMKVVRNVPYLLKYTGEKLLDYSNKKIILYQGALNVGRGLEWVIDAMSFIENAVLVIIGDGDIAAALKKRVNDLKITDKVFFPGRIAGAELHKYTPSADLGLCLLEHRGLNYYYALPNRIFDYLQAGVPVLATDFPEIANIVKTHKTGILINHYEPEYLAEVINDFFAKGFDTNHFAKVAEKFCWEEEEKILLEVIAR
ncbi:MAG: glycosyltransferase family 4 protein [Bacteroidetes bacterium]|nr:glycosyltransferase family 4 protein [Bacteroidota bacterium]MCL1968442.1 glycosyltransferase family 4 protein [Bacteroidota bacterium]